MTEPRTSGSPTEALAATSPVDHHVRTVDTSQAYDELVLARRAELDRHPSPPVEEARTRRARRRASVAEKLDNALFAFAGLSAIWLAYLLFRQGVRPGWPLLLLVVFWVMVTYLLLPRLHRILTFIYVPGYFIGRARTSDGLLGDPVNIALLAHEAQIHAAMAAAGWVRADDLTLRTGRRIVTSTLSRRSYAEAPVSALLLFDRQQDFAYQQEVAGSPSKRHHVRFWRCPEGWMLPGGYEADWLAAGTYDKSVGLSLFTFQITHKIEANTDIERDFIVDSVLEARPETSVRVIENFSTGYHSRNGGGDLIETDGDLPVLDLRRLDVPRLPEAEATDSRDKRPIQTVFGASVSLLRGGLYVIVGVLLMVLSRVGGLPGSDVDIEGLEGPTALVVGGVVIAVIGLVDLGFGIATLRGHNGARILVMLSAVLSTVSAFVGNVSGSEQITTAGNLATVGISVLVLLALSSHRARDWATRGHPMAKRITPRRELRGNGGPAITS